jgi:hypothetical protein
LLDQTSVPFVSRLDLCLPAGAFDG